MKKIENLRRTPSHAETIFNSADLRVIINLAEDGIISIASDQSIVLFNAGAEKIFGFRAEEVLGKPLGLLLPDQFRQPHIDHVHFFAAGSQVTRWMGERRELAGRRRDGTEFPAQISISKAHIRGEWFYTAIVRDTSERKLAEIQIINSLREKEALLKEMHHRVKNNLQVVSSLLNLQARACPDGAARKMLHDSHSRVHSMALLHDRLYRSENLSAIDCRAYVSDLAAHLFHSYGVDPDHIRLHLELAHMHMNLEEAVPCGLILNELISNSLKHAFPGGREGEIRIQLLRGPDCPKCLRVSDNGVGFPEAIPSGSTNHVGLRLVKILADQVGANLEVSSRNGTQVSLKFERAEEVKT
jgi:PAS domain S-box-containing protein